MSRSAASRSRKKPIEISDSLSRDYISGIFTTPFERSSEDREKTLVILVHNFPGHRDAHKGFLEVIENTFADKGCFTFRFDFRGCGKSEGKEEHFSLNRAGDDFDLVLNWADKQGFKKFIYVGEGLGARICLSKTSPAVRMLALFWPVLDTADYAQRNLGLGDGAGTPKDGYFTIGGHRIGEKLVFELLSGGDQLPIDHLDIPVLVHQGTADDIVPIRNLDILKEHLKSPRLDITTYQDGGHGLPAAQHRKMATFHISQFLQKYS